ncbi:MAG: dTDP-4-dehydrorhamnose reductase [Candidatus Thorarchaeota archaeon]
MNKTIRFLITGGAGQLGRDFQVFLKNKGINYFAPNRDLDITNIKKIRDFVRNKQINIIINCAAYNAVDSAEGNWKSAYLVNGIGPKNLAIVSNEIGATFIHYSSDYVFDGKKKKPYTIFDLPNPISRYGESKLLGERYTQLIANKFYLIRVSWVFGKGNNNFVKKVLEWRQRRSELAIVDDQTSSPTYTKDLVNATYDLIQTKAYGLYHITNSGFCSRYEWADYILTKVKWKGKLTRAKLNDFKTPAKRPSFSVLDNFGTKETIGYELPHWNEAIDEFLKELGEI